VDVYDPHERYKEPFEGRVLELVMKILCLQIHDFSKRGTRVLDDDHA
jgi:hypothetical protein